LRILTYPTCIWRSDCKCCKMFTFPGVDRNEEITSLLPHPMYRELKVMHSTGLPGTLQLRAQRALVFAGLPAPTCRVQSPMKLSHLVICRSHTHKFYLLYTKESCRRSLQVSSLVCHTQQRMNT